MFIRALRPKVKNSINSLQEFLKINRLSTYEISGNLSSASYSKIFRGSSLEVPFNLGRTIRGVAFEKKELDPYSLCLSRQNMFAFDEELFAKDLHAICVGENNKQVKDFIRNIDHENVLNWPVWTIAFPGRIMGSPILRKNIYIFWQKIVRILFSRAWLVIIKKY